MIYRGQVVIVNEQSAILNTIGTLPAPVVTRIDACLKVALGLT
jgi:hypothetical protein